jgi:hypothetical protein
LTHSCLKKVPKYQHLAHIANCWSGMNSQFRLVLLSLSMHMDDEFLPALDRNQILVEKNTF